MTHDPWPSVAAALDAAAADAVRVTFWLRDDDAVAVTPALERLGDLLRIHAAPLLLAVIPAGATEALGGWAAEQPDITPCQHGYAHRNHAVIGERACELGGGRDDAAVLSDLRAGQAAMDRIFGEAWTPLLVPPWNRIRPSLLPQLAAAGYAALSTFAGSAPATPSPLPRLDCDLDIIDWRQGRRGRSDDDLCHRLAMLIDLAQRTGAPVGLLTHHLAHDAQAWAFLDRLLPLLTAHPAASFARAAQILALCET